MRAIEKMGGVAVTNPTQGTQGGRMCDWPYMLEAGKKVGGFIGPELGKIFYNLSKFF